MKENDLKIINTYKKEGDIVYEVSKKEKRNFITIVVDFLLQVESESETLAYLIANRKEGTIIEISEEGQVQIHNIVEWSSDLKEKFKKIEIEDYIYTKKRII